MAQRRHEAARQNARDAVTELARGISRDKAAWLIEQEGVGAAIQAACTSGTRRPVGPRSPKRRHHGGQRPPIHNSARAAVRGAQQPSSVSARGSANQEPATRLALISRRYGRRHEGSVRSYPPLWCEYRRNAHRRYTCLVRARGANVMPSATCRPCAHTETTPTRLGDHAKPTGSDEGRHCESPFDVLDAKGAMRLEPLTESGVCRMGGVNAKGTPRADDPCTIGREQRVAERRKALSGLGVGHLTPSAAQHDLTEQRSDHV